ncbi:MAG TPA: serine hydrolase [Pirellulaceae bacterium]|nr:serine hydrolase [Pirellulaceae bacterium]
MIRRLHYLAAVALIALAAAAGAQELPPGIDEYVEAARSKWQVPALSIAVVKDGKVVHLRGYGPRSIGGSEPVDGQTVFRLASISKTFTAATAALLVEEGKLTWDDPIRKHVPEFELHDRYLTEHVSLRDCLSHRVGLETGDIVARRGDLSRDEILARLRFLQPYSPFRGKFKYNNLMYVAAGETVARAAGQSWEDFLSRRLLVPLGMRSTTPTFASLHADNLATAYRLHDGELQAVTTAPIIDAVAPAGSVHSSAADMARWLQFWLAEGELDGQRLLQRGTVREMLAMHSTVPIERSDDSNIYRAKFYGWGLGWSVLDYRGRKIHTHAGGSGTFIGFMPEAGIGVVVLTNLEFTNLGGMLMYDVFDAYLLDRERAWNRDQWPLWLAVDEPPEITGDKARAKLDAMRKAGTSPTLSLAQLAGKYRSDLYGEIEILDGDGGLQLKLGRNPPVKLQHWQDDTFVSPGPEADAPWFDWLLKFRITAGECEALDIERIGWDEPLPTFHRAADS